jgi:hypothetical protein
MNQEVHIERASLEQVRYCRSSANYRYGDLPLTVSFKELSQFMEGVHSGNGSTHVGFTTRNTTRGLQTSPVYEVDLPSGKYHFSSYISSGKSPVAMVQKHWQLLMPCRWGCDPKHAFS